MNYIWVLLIVAVLLLISYETLENYENSEVIRKLREQKLEKSIALETAELNALQDDDDRSPVDTRTNIKKTPIGGDSYLNPDGSVNYNYNPNHYNPVGFDLKNTKKCSRCFYGPHAGEAPCNLRDLYDDCNQCTKSGGCFTRVAPYDEDGLGGNKMPKNVDDIPSQSYSGSDGAVYKCQKACPKGQHPTRVYNRGVTTVKCVDGASPSGSESSCLKCSNMYDNDGLSCPAKNWDHDPIAPIHPQPYSSNMSKCTVCKYE